MGSDTHQFSRRLINVARVSLQPHRRQAARSTSGLRTRDYGDQRAAERCRPRRGCRTSPSPASSRTGDAQQPFVEPRQQRLRQFTDDLTWVTGRAFDEVRRRASGASTWSIVVHQPPERRLHVHRAPRHAAATPPADFLLGLPTQFRQATQRYRTWTARRGSTRVYGQDEFRPVSRVTLNAGLRYEVNRAVRGRATNHAERVPPGPAVDACSRTRRPASSIPGDAGVPRGTYRRPTRTTRAARSARCGIRPATAAPSLRGAWGIFYDALPGQGDFFQNGMLAPPFQPLPEVNSPPRGADARQPAARRSAAAPVDFPPGLIFIGWGTDFKTPFAQHYNLTLQQQIGGNLGAEVGYVGSRGYHLPIFMEVNPRPLRRRARRCRARGCSRRSASCGRRSRRRESWYDSLQASAADAAGHGMNFLASYTLGHAIDHVSGLNIGGEQRPMLPVTIGDQASIDAALALREGRRAVRRAAPLRPQLRRRAADADAPRRASSSTSLGGWQVERHRPGADRLPADVYDPTDRHPLS